MCAECEESAQQGRRFRHTPLQDSRLMQATIALSRRNLGLTAPNPCVGAIVVDARTGAIIGRGVTAPGGRPHAERLALLQAGEAARGGTIYVTLEPCARRSRTGDGPSCTDAILAAGIARVVIACPDPSPFAGGEGAKRLLANGIELVSGVGEAEARRLHLGHVTRVTQHRPFVQVKIARTQDGAAGTAHGHPVAITGDNTRNHVHMMRARADAIMVGVGTVLADDPQLTCRLPGLRHRSPIRVVMDGDLRTPMLSQLVKTAREFPTWLIGNVNASIEREWALRSAGVEVLRVKEETVGGRLDLSDALGLLADWGITRLMVEGGPTLVASLLEADLVDELTLLTGNWALGEPGTPALSAAHARLLQGTHVFRLVEQRSLGEDTLQLFERKA